MFGICLILDGREMNSHDGFATKAEAQENADFLNDRPARRYGEDGDLIYTGKWVVYRY